MGRGPRESIVDQQLAGRVLLVGLGVVLVGLLLMVLTVVVMVVLLLHRMLLLLGVGLLVVVVGRHGKVLLQQNLLVAGGVAAVVMAAATRAGSVAAAAAAVVCAVGNHLRCASRVCLILQCKITKVVERPGVHYRGRHSPGIFVRWSLPAGSQFPPWTAVFSLISRFTERNASFFRLNSSLVFFELALDFFSSERKFFTFTFTHCRC